VTNVTWITDHLKDKAVSNGEIQPPGLIPLLTYFSGREGFNSTESTISAPLASITACNSLRWSLLTLTHEISHILVNVMALQIYPRLRSDEDMQSTLHLLRPGVIASNLLDEIRQLLITTIVGIDSVYSGNYDVKYNKESLGALIEHWQREVEEILVHTFDFLWFYGRESEKYIRGIWMSWATVPNIANRIHDYVVRTICAVLSRYLLQGKAEEVAKDVVLATLKALQEDGMGGNHVAAAIDYIEQHWEDEILKRVIARKELIKIVLAFFFSETLATEARKEVAIVGGTESEKEGYPLTVGEIETYKITNPLRFLELYTTNRNPSAIESAWFFYVLAFYVELT
jgi:hypothetical protein